MIFQDKRILITGGTGSLGKNLVHSIMTGKFGTPKHVIVFSRDEDKQYAMEIEWKKVRSATDDIFYYGDDVLNFCIGDVRDYESVVRVVKKADVIINAAALKQVPIGEYFPFESVKTNILGAQNIIRAILETENNVETMLAVSTDKACKPVNTYGMCKAIQERLVVEANLICPKTRFICVRYGNVIASRGSVIPLFQEQIRSGGPVTITSKEMSRFMITMDNAINLIIETIRSAEAGDIYVPILSSANMLDLAEVMIGDKKINIRVIGVRPGEKIHEILVSEEEIPRTIKRGDYYVICPVLPKIRKVKIKRPVLAKELSSADNTMTKDKLKGFLQVGGYLNL
ncbi:MAG: polysaccharide biosynthesis protein [Dehalococcoidales bacterium]|nr:polysaccharide biosynthesis protein [Dehalococcoidales bacterium]